MLAELSSNEVWYTKAGHTTCGMRNLTFKQWLKLIKPKKASADELCIYALSVVFRRI